MIGHSVSSNVAKTFLASQPSKEDRSKESSDLPMPDMPTGLKRKGVIGFQDHSWNMYFQVYSGCESRIFAKYQRPLLQPPLV
jgi:hypothetical protein